MNLTSQLSRIVDNDSELISIYLHNAESKREYFLTSYSVLRWEYKIIKMVDRDEQYPFMIALLEKSEIRPTAFY